MPSTPALHLKPPADLAYHLRVEFRGIEATVNFSVTPERRLTVKEGNAVRKVLRSEFERIAGQITSVVGEGTMRIVGPDGQVLEQR